MNHFDPDMFRSLLSTAWLGKSFVYLPEVDSTNAYLKKNSELPDGTVCLTDFQTVGRGQKTNHWVSEPGKNLTFSIILKPTAQNRIHVLKQVAGMSVADVIRDRIHTEVKLKWPNDVIVNGRKIAGVLVECTFCGTHLERVVIGVGMNVFQTRFPDDITLGATSLRILDPTRSYSRELILSAVLNRFEYYYQLWTTQAGDLVTRFNPALVGFGQWCTLEVEGSNRPQRYKMLGMNPDGYLRALTPDYEVVNFTHEDIRIHESD